jgi:dTDP-4-dehydrorhamnose reductase
MEPIVIIGVSGALGREIEKQLVNQEIRYVGFSRINYDFLAGLGTLVQKFDELKPRAIINCAAFNGYDKCAESPSDAYEINGIHPEKLRLISTICNFRVIHVSSEAVFLGNKTNYIYLESDQPNPDTVYGASKLFGEGIRIQKQSKKNSFHVVRLPLLFGPTNQDQIVAKLVKRALTGSTVDISYDVFSTPVYTPHAAEKIITMALSQNPPHSVIHLTSNRLISLGGLVECILRQSNAKFTINPVSNTYFNNKVANPLNCGLSSDYGDFLDFDLSICEYVQTLNDQNF